MVRGLDIFTDVFAGFSDCYVIIGGTACDLILSDTDMRPRATDDIDILLVVENLTPEFGAAFWQFIQDGGYKRGVRRDKTDGSPRYVLYSFDEPTKGGYPIKIELLSKHSDNFAEPTNFHIEPIAFDEVVSALSAIMVNEELYDITIKESEIINDVRVASPIALICLKIKAYKNLLVDRESGKQVNSKDIKKHRNDVLKLIATTSFVEPKIVHPAIMADIQWYVSYIDGMLPDQSLEASLERDTEDIKAFLDVLNSSFVSD